MLQAIHRKTQFPSPPPHQTAAFHHQKQGDTVHTSRLYLLAKTLEIMLDDNRIGADEIATYVAIQRRTDSTGHCRPAQSTLASELGKSRPWANAKVKRLVECNYLEVAHRFKAKGGQTSNLYYLPHLDRSAITIAPPSGCHHDDTPCHSEDTNLTDSELEEEISLSVQERGVFEKLCKGGDQTDPTIEPIQVRHPATCDLIPDDWQPSKADLDWADTTRPDIDDIPRFTAKFITKINAGGGTNVPIWVKWRQWLAMEATPRRQRPKPPSDRKPVHGTDGIYKSDVSGTTPTHPSRLRASTNSIAEHNAAMRQEAMDMLNGLLAPKSTSTIEIVVEQTHGQ